MWRYLICLKYYYMFHTMYSSILFPALSFHPSEGAAATHSSGIVIWTFMSPRRAAPDASTSQAQNESFPVDEGQGVSSDGWTERDQGDISLTSWSSSISHIKLLLKVLLVLQERFYAAFSSWLLCDILKRGTQSSNPFLRAKGCFSRKSCLLPVRSIH